MCITSLCQFLAIILKWENKPVAKPNPRLIITTKFTFIRTQFHICCLHRRYGCVGSCCTKTIEQTKALSGKFDTTVCLMDDSFWNSFLSTLVTRTGSGNLSNWVIPTELRRPNFHHTNFVKIKKATTVINLYTHKLIKLFCSKVSLSYVFIFQCKIRTYADIYLDIHFE